MEISISMTSCSTEMVARSRSRSDDIRREYRIHSVFGLVVAIPVSMRVEVTAAVNALGRSHRGHLVHFTPAELTDQLELAHLAGWGHGKVVADEPP